MPLIEFDVLDPPTSGEVQESAVRKLMTHDLLELILIQHQEVPRTDPEKVRVSIRQTVHPEEGGMIIGGFTEQDKPITVRMPQDLGAPAVASIVS